MYTYTCIYIYTCICIHVYIYTCIYYIAHSCVCLSRSRTANQHQCLGHRCSGIDFRAFIQLAQSTSILYIHVNFANNVVFLTHSHKIRQMWKTSWAPPRNHLTFIFRTAKLIPTVIRTKILHLALQELCRYID